MILKNGKRIDGCTDTLPVGTVQPFLGLTPPLGYLVCQGQLISKIEYPELYAICGSTFGTETDTHFYLPDLRGKTIAGYDSSDTTMNTIGKLLGNKTHTHTSAAHTHTIAEHIHTTGNHTLTIDEIPWHGHAFRAVKDIAGTDSTGTLPKANNGQGNNQGWGPFGEIYTENAVQPTGGNGAHNHGNTGSTALTTDSTTPEATGSNSNFQPTITMNWIVKAVMLIPEYFVVENTLTSTSTSNALSAAQGKILNDKFANYLPLSGGTLTGMLTIGQGDSQCIHMGTDGRVNVTVGSSTNATVLGIVDGAILTGTLVAPLNLRGSDTSPNYNGTPLIESGTNSNGSYIKFFDGTMICRCKVTKTVTMNTAYGSVYGANFGGITFPATFTDIPTVSWGSRNIDNTRGYWVGTYNGITISTTGISGLHLFRHNENTEASDIEVHVTAIGSWK